MRVDLAVMPASTTHKFQMIDVILGKPFKARCYDMWAKWMIEESNSRITKVGNRQRPTRPNVVDWCRDAWAGLPNAMIADNAEKLLMTAAFGPEVVGYEKKGLGQGMEVEEEESSEDSSESSDEETSDESS